MAIINGKEVLYFPLGTKIILPDGTEVPVYDGPYSVTPRVDQDITLSTSQMMFDEDIVINKVPYAVVTNNSGGKTVTIG